MPFTVEDFQDLIRILEQHPEWRAELRRRLLPEELLTLPDLVRDVVEAVGRLAEAQRRSEERLSAVEARLERARERERIAGDGGREEAQSRSRLSTSSSSSTPRPGFSGTSMRPWWTRTGSRQMGNSSRSGWGSMLYSCG
jgi:hypothetical protein